MKYTYTVYGRNSGKMYEGHSRSAAIKKYNSVKKKQFVTLYAEHINAYGENTTSVVKDSLGESNRTGKLESWETKEKPRQRRNPRRMGTYEVEAVDASDRQNIIRQSIGVVEASNRKAAINKAKRGKRFARGVKFAAILKQQNPQATKFPKGKFVKVQAVRVNRDGTITVKK